MMITGLNLQSYLHVWLLKEARGCDERTDFVWFKNFIQIRYVTHRVGLLSVYPETRTSEEAEKAKVKERRDAKGQFNKKWGHVGPIDGLSSTKGSLFGDEFGLIDNVWVCVLCDIISFTFEAARDGIIIFS